MVWGVFWVFWGVLGVFWGNSMDRFSANSSTALLMLNEHANLF